MDPIRAVDARVTSLSYELADVKKSVPELKMAVFFRKGAQVAQDVERVAHLVDTLRHTLYDLQGGIHDDIARCQDARRAFSRLETLQVKEREFLELAVTVETIKGFSDAHVLELYAAFRQSALRMIAPTCSMDDFRAELQCYRDAKWKMQPVAQDWLRLLEKVVRRAMEAIDDDELLGHARGILQEVEHERLLLVRDVNQAEYQRADRPELDALLRGFKTLESSFRFWKKSDTYTWAVSFLPGSYRDTSPLVDRIEQQVAQKIDGLRGALHSVTGELYTLALSELRLRIEECRDAVFASTLDALTLLLLDYLNGLELSLVELQKRAERLIVPDYGDSLAVLKGYISYNSPANDAVSRSFDFAKKTYEAGRDILDKVVEFVPNRNNSVARLHEQMTYATISNLFKTHVPDRVQLMSYEEVVFDQVMQQQEVAPKILHSYLLKRIGRMLFTSFHEVIDSGLELFLHVLKTRKMVDEPNTVVEAVAYYDKVYSNGRDPALLDRAYDALTALYEVKDLYSHAQALQKCIAFRRQEPRQEQRLQHENLTRMLFNRLENKTFFENEGPFVQGLACCLYGNGAQDEGYVEHVLTSDVQAAFRATFGDATKRLIEEYSMKKVLEGNFRLSAYESSLLCTGPIAAFFAHGKGGKIERVLYLLTLHECTAAESNRPITSLFLANKSREAFESWRNTYRSFLASTKAHQAFYSTKNSLESVKKELGPEEAVRWQEAVVRSRRFKQILE